MRKCFFAILTLFFFIEGYSQVNNLNLIIGTYTNSCFSKGIYVYDFNSQTGDLKLKNTSENIINPSYLTVSNDEKFIYCVNEDGDKSTVSAFGFNPDKGDLKFLNKVSSEGADPCYLINDEKNVIVATYSGGTISVFGKNSDGSISKNKQVIKHSYEKSNNSEKLNVHIHMVQFSPNKEYLLATDLGTDLIHVYKYNPDSKNAVLEFLYPFKIKLNSGPRHFTFSPDGKFIYLIQELDGSVTVFDFYNGKLKVIQESTVVENSFKGKISAADIHISPDGKFLYATNRGDANTISCFEIKKNGKLKQKFTTTTLGKGPRNFVIDPTGNFLLVAHQYTNNVVVFKINKLTGELSNTDKNIELCSPVCLVFTP